MVKDITIELIGILNKHLPKLCNIDSGEVEDVIQLLSIIHTAKEIGLTTLSTGRTPEPPINFSQWR
jgi:hypothetical protein|tara:strand:+ start:490 stop:687 length:198 start_codon:yes stop_codon:yes gene_type:complete